MEPLSLKQIADRLGTAAPLDAQITATSLSEMISAGVCI